MNTSEWSAILLGGVGTALGIYNTARQVARDRVRLRVSLKKYFQMGSSRWNWAVEVVNIGAIAVTVNSVGLQGRHGLGLMFVVEYSLDTRRAPWQLDARTSVSVPVDMSKLTAEQLRDATHIYALTNCNVCVKSRVRNLAAVLKSDAGKT